MATRYFLTIAALLATTTTVRPSDNQNLQTTSEDGLFENGERIEEMVEIEDWSSEDENFFGNNSIPSAPEAMITPTATSSNPTRKSSRTKVPKATRETQYKVPQAYTIPERRIVSILGSNEIKIGKLKKGRDPLRTVAASGVTKPHSRSLPELRTRNNKKPNTKQNS